MTMTETGLYEFTAEMHADRTYEMAVKGGDIAGLRYTVSTDPEVEPPPVTVGSNLYARWVGSPAAGFVKVVSLDRYAHFRFLLTGGPDATPPSQVTVSEIGRAA